MGLLRGKRIVLGVSGSIAAYKSAFLVRGLVKAGAEVQVILTPSARDFVTPLTLATLSKRPALSDLLANADAGVWNNHVELGLWADAMLIAPASANTLAKMAQGEANNLLLTTFMSARCPVFFAPAMDVDMHASAANQHNIALLEQRGFHHIPSEEGELASGLEGTGRMAEPEHIVDFLEKYYRERAPFLGKTVLVSAGPTYEAIDPVRYIGNRSSGKMGYAIAEIFAQAGARVLLVSGPTALPCPDGVQRIVVESAQDMLEAVQSKFGESHIVIMSAAVADYRPASIASKKIKKGEEPYQIKLEPTVDILAALGKIKGQQLLVGFALETDNALENARKKLVAKNCDLIVLNTLEDEGAGFGHDTNKVTFVGRNNEVPLALKSKREVADDLLQYILNQLE